MSRLHLKVFLGFVFELCFLGIAASCGVSVQGSKYFPPTRSMLIYHGVPWETVERINPAPQSLQHMAGQLPHPVFKAWAAAIFHLMDLAFNSKISQPSELLIWLTTSPSVAPVGRARKGRSTQIPIVPSPHLANSSPTTIPDTMNQHHISSHPTSASL